jgi:hypothetical protein
MYETWIVYKDDIMVWCQAAGQEVHSTATSIDALPTNTSNKPSLLREQQSDLVNKNIALKGSRCLLFAC